jgi:hypothetical protein
MYIKLYGGYAGVVTDQGQATADNNIVTIKGTQTATNGIELYGGVYDNNIKISLAGTGNKLVIDNTKLSKVSALVGFQKYEFDLNEMSKEELNDATIIDIDKLLWKCVLLHKQV